MGLVEPYRGGAPATNDLLARARSLAGAETPRQRQPRDRAEVPQQEPQDEGAPLHWIRQDLLTAQVLNGQTRGLVDELKYAWALNEAFELGGDEVLSSYDTLDATVQCGLIDAAWYFADQGAHLGPTSSFLEGMGIAAQGLFYVGAHDYRDLKVLVGLAAAGGEPEAYEEILIAATAVALGCSLAFPPTWAHSASIADSLLDLMLNWGDDPELLAVYQLDDAFPDALPRPKKAWIALRAAVNVDVPSMVFFNRDKRW